MDQYVFHYGYSALIFYRNNKKPENWFIEKPPIDKSARTEDVTKTKGQTFEEYFLKRELLMGIYDFGFASPSPIQEESIPVALLGRDIMARAKNGTGKTASFLIPALQKVDPNIPSIQVLVLLPTRELALQTSYVCKQLGKYIDGLNVMVSTGGTNLRDDLIRLKSSIHVIIGTPGRIHDLASKGELDLGKCTYVVADEADKFFSMEILEIFETILTKYLPKNRQLLLFSATFPEAISRFRRFMNDPMEINLIFKKLLTLKGITQYYILLDEAHKVQCLNTLFKRLTVNQTIIFCSSHVRVEMLTNVITSLGYSCFYIHGKMDQDQRNRVFHEFRNSEARNLVCTDLFTRGIDFQSVNVVINFDFPRYSETYLHRIGRAGRFGRYGLAINFVTEKDKYFLVKIESELRTEMFPYPADSRVDERLYVPGYTSEQVESALKAIGRMRESQKSSNNCRRENSTIADNTHNANNLPN